MITPDLQALIELSEKATAGPWEMYGGTNHGRVQTADVIVCDGSAPHFMDPADAKFIAALVNWFRSNHSTQPGAGGGDDTARLDWVIKNRNYRVQGSDANGWFVLDCTDGLTFLTEGKYPTYRQAIDAALLPQQGG